MSHSLIRLRLQKLRPLVHNTEGSVELPTQFSQHIPHWSIEKAGHQAYRVVVWTGGPWLDVAIETISFRFACVGITLQ
jgi:hypothetical protein